jgi:hypothetical protein
MRERLRHLPVGLVASLVLLIAGTHVAGTVDGPSGALGALLGLLLVVLSFVVSSVVVAWADQVHPKMVLPVGLAAYVVKFTLLGMVLVAMPAWRGLGSFAWLVVTGTLTWVTVQAVWLWRTPMLYVNTPAPTVVEDG